MNKEYFSNSTKLININRKKKQDRDLKILRENRQERREEEEEGKIREKRRDWEEISLKVDLGCLMCIICYLNLKFQF